MSSYPHGKGAPLEAGQRLAATCNPDSLQDMGLRTVAVFSEVDRNALHVQMADEA